MAGAGGPATDAALEHAIKARSGQFELECVAKLSLDGVPLPGPDIATCAVGRCTNVTSLSLRGCKLRSLEGVQALPGLRLLDAGDNKLASLGPLRGPAAESLAELHVDGNGLAAPADLEVVKGLRELHTLSVRGNPALDSKQATAALLATLPLLRVLDGQIVTVKQVSLREWGIGRKRAG
jgi:Leucine-rich repeat (LRR) protein